MTGSHDDKKRPLLANAPTDSEAVGLSTVPRRRIVVGGEPKTASSNPPADSAGKRSPGSSPGAREKRSSAPAHLRSRRERLPDTGYSEVPSHAEDRVAPSAIPRAPRLPQIDGDKGDGVGSTPAPANRTAVGVMGAGLGSSGGASRRPAEETEGRSSSPAGARGPLRRSDTARSVPSPMLPELDPAAGTTVIGVSSGPVLPAEPPAAPSAPLPPLGRFDEMPPATDANFPPVYSPSGTLQSMAAVRPEVSSLPSPMKFTSTLTGAGSITPLERELLAHAARESERVGAVAPPSSVRFPTETTMVGMPRVTDSLPYPSDSEPPPVRPLRPSPPPVVLSDRAESLSSAIAAAAQGQLRESEMPVPSERLEADVLHQLGQLDEALKSSPRLPSFERPASSRPGSSLPASSRPGSSRPGFSFTGRAAFDLQVDERPAEASGRLESAPGSSIDAPSPGSVPAQSALPGEGPDLGPSGLPTVGRYEVLARLKSGGMGSVYMCRLSGNAGFRRLFAMKVLHAHLNRDAEALESFQREARVLACVHHPNIVGVVDFGSEREPYIVLEYVEGGSLHELLRATTGGRDPRLVLTVLLDVLEGLAAAHAANDEQGAPLGLVHCDVCPQNILVGVDGTARLTDFGIAQTNESRLQPEQLRGKPRYLAPERSSSSMVDARADLFSLGVVLYSSLSGVDPFVGETAEETRWNVSNKTAPAPSTVGFRPPPSLDWLCLKALAKDPAGRFQSAEEMAGQLRRIAEREGLLAPRNEVSEWVRVTLAPSLAARRVASRRGTVTGGGRLGSNTPPRVQPVDLGPGALPSRSPTAPPSSAEHTAPLSSESADFSDNTEVIGRDGARRLRSKRVLYGAVALCLGILLWAMLAPQSLARIFSIEDEPGNHADNQESADEDPSGAIVPELGPSFEDAPPEGEEREP